MRVRRKVKNVIPAHLEARFQESIENTKKSLPKKVSPIKFPTRPSFVMKGIVVDLPKFIVHDGVQYVRVRSTGKRVWYEKKLWTDAGAWVVGPRNK